MKHLLSYAQQFRNYAANYKDILQMEILNFTFPVCGGHITRPGHQSKAAKPRSLEQLTFSVITLLMIYDVRNVDIWWKHHTYVQCWGFQMHTNLSVGSPYTFQRLHMFWHLIPVL